MGQSLAQVYVHIIYSTKNRQPFLQDVEFRHGLHAYLGGICQHQGCPTLAIGGVEDHVHVLCRLGKTIDVATLLREQKRSSSLWVKTKRSDLQDFQWQDGYGAVSVSPSHVDDLKKYIASQAEHHRRATFQDEFRRICSKYGVKLDEHYAWD